jgi:arsenate reductase
MLRSSWTDLCQGCDCFAPTRVRHANEGLRNAVGNFPSAMSTVAGAEFAMNFEFFVLPSTPLEYAILAKRAVPIILLVSFWCWETWRPFFGQQASRVRHAARNLAIALFNTVFLGLVFVSVTVMVADWTEQNQYGLLHVLDLAGPAQFALALVLLDGWMPASPLLEFHLDVDDCALGQERVETMTHDERPKRVLFVCVENCNRSQMAEAFARMYGAGQVEAYSAGCHPAEGVHPKAIAAMKELGYDMHQHFPKGISAVSDIEFDVAVTMGCEDQRLILNAKHREDWNIPCPKAMPPEQFQIVRDEIKEKVRNLLARLSVMVEGEPPTTAVKRGAGCM